MHTRIKIIKFNKSGINFDISFIIIDEIQSEILKNTFPLTGLNNQEFEEIIEHKRQKSKKLYKPEDLSEIESEIYSLASFNSNNIMFEFIEMTGNVNKFEIFARTIKKWAKSKFSLLIFLDLLNNNLFYRKEDVIKIQKGK